MKRLKATVFGVSAATILAIATTGSLAAEKKEITFAAIACNVKRFIRHAQQCACPALETA